MNKRIEITTTNQTASMPVRFKGIGVIHPNGTEPERSFVHPNAVRIWHGRFG